MVKPDDERTEIEQAERRPYEAPRVLEEAEFETLALQCTMTVEGGCGHTGTPGES